MSKIGHNSRAFAAEIDAEEDDKRPPTADEARIVGAAIAYIQFKRPGLEAILEKKKGKDNLGWRLVLVNALKDRVRGSALAKILGYNRKTMGENQQRVDAWIEHDEEHGAGDFGELIAALRDAIKADAYVDIIALEPRIKAYTKLDPELRELERQKRAAEAAAIEAERIANELEARASGRKQRLAEKEKRLRYNLKGVPTKRAIVAQHEGPERTAKKLSDRGIAVIDKLVRSENRGIRPLGSTLDGLGLKECLALGLAREALPHLAPKTNDPPYGPTPLGQRVFLEAVQQGRITLKSKAGRKK